MSEWFLLFFLYSFLGWCLEKLFAAAIRSPQRRRKCFLLLPLCPVYGLSMVLVMAWIPVEMAFLVRVILGGMICTVVEYLAHWFYQRWFHVTFWDYSSLPGQVDGRVCAPFSLAWGLLSALSATYLQPGLDLLIACTPPLIAYGLWMLLAADSVLSADLLYRHNRRDLLSLPVLWAYIREESQSATS